MGWANDFYDYLLTDPIYRKYKHTALNFPLLYAFTENYCLPISHDEVVHGKLSFINKMYGGYEDKFRQMRAALLLQMTYPGKKLLFMGTEYAQFREWNYADSLEWFMLDYPTHTQMREYVAALNAFYLKTKPLWELDFCQSGFSWILADEAEKNIVAYRRFDSKRNSIIVIINFSGKEQEVTVSTLFDNKIKCIFETQLGVSRIVNLSDGEKEKNYKISLAAFSGVIYDEKPNKKKIIL